MSKAIIVRKTGGPEVLQFEDRTLEKPAPGEVLVRHTAIGLNFIDTYFRSGLYPAPQGTPFVLGNEAAGEVVEVGEGVTYVNPGDRVAYVTTLGSYAEERLISADHLIRLPDSIDDKTAAAMMLKGMTARYLLRKTYNVGPQTTMLFHAAAGGVGTIVGQWASHLGATVIGTAGSDEKVEQAKQHGYTHVINYKRNNFVERVKEITNGKGCDVVYDGVGKDTFPASLDCIKPRGLFVSFGNASGPVDSFNLGILSQKGSLFVTRPKLFDYTATREDLEETANDLIDVVSKGIVTIEVNQTYPLKDAAKAHDDLEARRTTGATILLP
jgi:NADPH2:quinone reductase